MGKTSKALGKSGYNLDVQTKSDMVKKVGGSVIPLENTTNRQAEEESVSKVDLNRSPVSSDVLMESSKRRPVTITEWDERLIKVASSSNKTAESFRVLRSKILLPQDGRSAPKTIMVTSALPQEGKSFVSANLGVSLAQGMDQHSLVIDCDLRAPSLAPLFGLPSEKGLVDYLQGKEDLSSLIWKTSLEKLSILPSGLPPANPADLLGSERMQNLVAELASRYPDRYVIFDTPPLEVASESKVLSQTVDGVVLVVRQGLSNRTLIKKFITEIGKEKIIGVIFNGHKSNFISTRLVDKSHYYYGKYYKAKD